MPRRLSTSDAAFDDAFDAFLELKRDTESNVEGVVADILSAVRARGDAAVAEFTERFDGVDLSVAGFRFSAEEIAGAAAVVDMVYGGQTTDLVARARELKLPAADGREVLLHQGIAQFAAFTQRVPPKEEMRKALMR